MHKFGFIYISFGFAYLLRAHPLHVFGRLGGVGVGGVRVCAPLRASRKEIPTTLHTQEGALSSSIEPKTKCEKGKAEGCPGVVSLWTVAVRVGARGGDLGGGFISWSKTPYAPQGGAADI